MHPLAEADKALLSRYPWPGNVRELQNIIERAVIIAQNGTISWETLIPKSLEDGAVQIDSNSEKIYSSEELIKLERENILRALRKTHWKISGKNGAAAILQLKPTTLTSKIKALHIARPI